MSSRDPTLSCLFLDRLAKRKLTSFSSGFSASTSRRAAIRAFRWGPGTVVNDPICLRRRPLLQNLRVPRRCAKNYSRLFLPSFRPFGSHQDPGTDSWSRRRQRPFPVVFLALLVFVLMRHFPWFGVGPGGCARVKDPHSCATQHLTRGFGCCNQAVQFSPTELERKAKRNVSRLSGRRPVSCRRKPGRPQQIYSR